MGNAGGGQLVVAAALVDRWPSPTRLLAARRSRGTFGGLWEFPGGKVEPTEQPVAALRRELAEELSLTDIEIGPELPAPGGLWPVAHGWRMRVWFVTGAPTDAQPGGDHDAVAWLDIDRLTDVDWLPADGPIVAALAECVGQP